MSIASYVLKAARMKLLKGLQKIEQLLLVIYLWPALDLYFWRVMYLIWRYLLFLCICQNTRFLKENFYKDLLPFYMPFYKPGVLTHCSVNHH